MPTENIQRRTTRPLISYNSRVMIFLTSSTAIHFFFLFCVHANRLIPVRRHPVPPSEKDAMAGVIDAATATWL